MKNSIKTVIDNQKKYFQSKNTFDISKRKNYLIKLRKEIRKNESEIELALFKDLGKSRLI